MRSWFQGLWILVLISTPFLPEACFGRSPSPYSYAYVAVGILLGAVAHFAVVACIPFARRAFFDRTVATTGVVLGLVLQLGTFGLAGFGSFWVPLFACPSVLHRALLVVEGCCCSLYAVGSPAFVARGKCECPVTDDNVTTVSVHLVMLICGLLFVFGFGRLGQFALALRLNLPFFEAAPELAKLLVPFAFALPVAAVLALLGSKPFVSRFGCPACSSCLKVALVSLASGRIVWGLASHAYGDADAMLSISVPMMGLVVLCDIALVCCCVALLRKRNAATEALNPEMERGTFALRGIVDDLTDLHGLTDREAEAVFHCIQGLTSAESARQMGLKPSTVRCYLQRAYKKIGVLDAEGLKHYNDRLKPTEALSENGKSEDAVNDELASDATGQVLRWALFVAIAVFAFPRFGGDSIFAWHFNHAAIAGFGLGVLLCAERVFSLKTLWQDSSASHVEISHFGWLLTGILILLACLQFVAVCALYPAISSRADYGTCIVLVAASSCLLSLVISSLCCLAIRVGRGDCQRKVSMIAAGVGASLVVVSQTGDVGWVISALMSSGLLAGMCAIVKRREPRFSDGKVSIECKGLAGEQKVVLFVAALSISFVFGEQWHGAQDPFVDLVQLLFLVSTTALLVWRRWEMLKTKPALSALLLALISLCCLFSGFAWGVQVMLLLLLLLLPADSLDCLADDKALSCLLGCGTGLLVGRLLVDRWSELMELPLENLAMQGDPSYISFATPLLMALALLAGFACVSVLEGPAAPHQEDDALLERRLMFLRSQGLSDLEANVLSKTAQGMTTAQIAIEMHYSVRYIGTIRAQGYDKLDMHTRLELVDRLDDAVATRRQR